MVFDFIEVLKWGFENKFLSKDNKIMKNDNIPQELKYFINGARYLYVKYMIHQINKINDKCLFVYPVGSTKLTSDKDIQISFNINCNFPFINNFIFSISINRKNFGFIS